MREHVLLDLVFPGVLYAMMDSPRGASISGSWGLHVRVFAPMTFESHARWLARAREVLPAGVDLHIVQGDTHGRDFAALAVACATEEGGDEVFADALMEVGYFRFEVDRKTAALEAGVLARKLAMEIAFVEEGLVPPDVDCGTPSYSPGGMTKGRRVYSVIIDDPIKRIP